MSIVADRAACTLKRSFHRDQERNHASEDCKDGRPQEGHGHDQEHGLSEVWQDDANCEAGEGPRAGRPGRDLYLVLGL